MSRRRCGGTDRVGSGLGPPMGWIGLGPKFSNPAWVGLGFVLDMTDFLDFVILVLIK